MSKESLKKNNQKEITLHDPHTDPAITISYQESVLEFLQTLPKADSVILVDVEKTQEACVFGVEVSVKILKKSPEIELISAKIEMPELNGHPIYISKEFKRFFGKYTQLRLEVKGRFRKRIVCTNIPPYIKNICKV